MRQEREMRIAIETSSYNPRRDGKPWVCRITSWAVGSPRPEIVWGAWMGTPGGAGTLIVEAAPGDLIRHGQNDLRARNHTYRQYCRVEADGSLTDLSDAQACQYWQVERLQPAAETATT